MTFPNGVANTRTYDADGRLTDTSYWRGGSASFSRAAYTFDNLGQRISVERADGYGDTFAYDTKDQVAAIDYEVQSPANGGTPPLRSGQIESRGHRRLHLTARNPPHGFLRMQTVQPRQPAKERQYSANFGFASTVRSDRS